VSIISVLVLKCELCKLIYIIRHLAGAKVRYGQSEPWKKTAIKIGRTKPSRASRPEKKKNDGRPPDTSKELLGKKKKKKPLKTSPSPETDFGPPSYPWVDNSCWLDSSLELLFVTVMRDFDDFSSLFASVPTKSLLYQFYKVMDSRKCLPEDASNEMVLKSNRSDRDGFRRKLYESGFLKDIKSPNSFSVRTSLQLLGNNLNRLSIIGTPAPSVGEAEAISQSDAPGSSPCRGSLAVSEPDSLFDIRCVCGMTVTVTSYTLLRMKGKPFNATNVCPGLISHVRGTVERTTSQKTNHFFVIFAI